MGTLRFFEEVVSFKIRRTFGFADYTERFFRSGSRFFLFGSFPDVSDGPNIRKVGLHIVLS